MPDEIPIPPVKKVEMVEGKELKVDKPGTFGKGKTSVKFRPMKADSRGRARKLKNDYRYVQYY